MKAKQIRGLMEKVRGVLKDIPETRNSDKLLTVKLWQRYHRELIVEGTNLVALSNILLLPSEDAISRCRREIQHDDKQYPPTSEDVAKARGWNIEEWKRALGYMPAFQEALF
jgi:hypothetical protein